MLLAGFVLALAGFSADALALPSVKLSGAATMEEGSTTVINVSLSSNATAECIVKVRARRADRTVWHTTSAIAAGELSGKAVITHNDDDIWQESGHYDMPVWVAAGDCYQGPDESGAKYVVRVKDNDEQSNTAPAFGSETLTRSVAENSASGTSVGDPIPAATDADNDALTYTLEGTDAASFTFDASTRQITTASGVTYDHEDRSSHSVTVKADDGNGGTDTVAVTITVSDVDEPPAAPGAPTVSATANSTTGLDVAWTAPANTGKPAITGYDLQYRAESSGTWTNGPQDVPTTSSAIAGLTAGTFYEVQVRATNAEGDSGWSDSGSGTTGTTPVASFDSSASNADEGAGTRSVTLNLSPAPQSAITLSYTVGGTATAGHDFTIANSGSVQVMANATVATIPVVVVDDTDDEIPETVVLTLGSGSPYYTAGPTNEHTLTINDNDGGDGGGVDDDDDAGDGNTVTDDPDTDSTDDDADETDAGTGTGTSETSAGNDDGDRSGSEDNAAPVVTNPIPDQATTVATAFRFTFGEGTFADPDGDPLSYAATRPDGSALPAWLAFAPASRTFSGTPHAVDVGTVTVRVTASDGNGGTASDDFAVAVSAVPTVVTVSGGDPVIEGEATAFTLTANPPPQAPVEVVVRVTRTGDLADAGETGERTVTVGVDGTGTLAVATTDDDIDEADGSVTATVLPGRGYVPGEEDAARVAVSDDDGPRRRQQPAAGASPFLAGLGRTVADHAAAAIAARMAADRLPGLSGTLAGQALPSGNAAPPAGEATGFVEEIRRFLARPDAGDATSGETAMTGREAVAGTAFALAAKGGDGARLAYWGRGARSGFGGTDGGMTVEGEVTGFTLGTERAAGDRLFGLMLSRSLGDGTYRAPRRSGRIASGLTSVVPWVARGATGGVRVWGAMGLGAGEITMMPDGGDAVSADIRWRMAAAGLEGAFDPRNVPGGRLFPLATFGAADFRWTADALWSRTASDAAPGLPAASGTAGRLRFGLEGRWTRTLASGTLLAPRLGIGLRHDWGDAGSGLGLEVRGGADWSDPARGLSLGLEGRTLALHDDGDFEDWGLALAVSWDPRTETRRGLSATVNGALGGAGSGGLAALPGPAAFPDATDGDGGAWSAEVAHGNGLGKGMVGSAYGRASGSLGTKGEVRFGWRVEPDASHAANAGLDLWAEPGADGDGSAVGAGIDWRW